MTAATPIRCPVVLCRRENAYGTELCAGCRTPLSGYARLHTYPAHLFNRGLALAHEGRLTAARDCFAAVVLWCPTDTEARNALALTALHLGDPLEAHRHWMECLGRRPGDPKATRGLARLRELARVGGPGEGGDPAGGPGEPGGPDESGGPGEPGGSGESTEAAGPGEPDAPGVLKVAGAPEVPGEAAESDEPGGAATAAEPNKAAEPDEPAEPAEPGGRGGSVESGGAGVSGRFPGSG
ncbi:hypothetical protein [Streptomyces tailanensis]|uniref:hypothetical protein n=1 Tax=Streptomyces tailanensis TaxID=2569858 RepID=UPI001C0EE51B|nr:hypothetical protein [Streptomyces tailanensis]